jgi:endogenous inhibitor of DNA gyrase (YacG/DUF329 family)
MTTATCHSCGSFTVEAEGDKQRAVCSKRTHQMQELTVLL